MTTKTSARPFFLPHDHEDVVLKAAVLPGREALEAWNVARDRFELDGLTSESLRLAPLLYTNLQTHGVDDPLMPKLKGHYRRTWYINQLISNELGPVLEAFRGAGIETMVLKGAGLLAKGLFEYGHRPMSDADVLVHLEDAPAAIQLLRDSGWKPTAGPIDRFLEHRHALDFVKVEKDETRAIDLHWRPGRLYLLPDHPMRSEDGFWDRSVEVTFGGTSTRALSPADDLLQIFLHAALQDSVTRFRWPADALAIINGSAVSWDVLVEQSKVWLAVPTVRDALVYLADELDAPVPPALLEELATIPLTRREKLAHKLAGRRPTSKNALVTKLSWVIGRYLRWSAEWRWPRALLSFPRFLKHELAENSLWKVIVRGARKLSGHAPSRAASWMFIYELSGYSPE